MQPCHDGTGSQAGSVDIALVVIAGDDAALSELISPLEQGFLLSGVQLGQDEG